MTGPILKTLVLSNTKFLEIVKNKVFNDNAKFLEISLLLVK